MTCKLILIKLYLNKFCKKIEQKKIKFKFFFRLSKTKNKKKMIKQKETVKIIISNIDKKELFYLFKV